MCYYEDVRLVIGPHGERDELILMLGLIVGTETVETENSLKTDLHICTVVNAFFSDFYRVGRAQRSVLKV